MSDLNLYRIDSAGVISTHSVTVASESTFGLADGSASTGVVRRIDLDEVGVAVGERLSVSARVAFDAGSQTVRLSARFRDAAGTSVRVARHNTIATPVGLTEQKLEGLFRQAGEQTVELFAENDGGSGDLQIDRGMTVRGSTVGAFRLPFRNERGLHLVRHQLETVWSMAASIVAPRGSESQVSQRSDWGGRLRTIDQGYPELKGELGRLMRADIARLNKGMAAFNFMDTRRQMPSTGIIALGVVNGASQLGKTLNVVKSATVSPSIGDSELVARAGDLVSVDVQGHWQLFTLTAEARTNASGEVTLQLDHALRYAPANGSLVRFSQPVVTMTSEASLEEVSTLLGRRGGGTIQFVEAI